MKTNRIPETLKPLVSLAYDATTAAEESDTAIGLKQNTGAALRADLETLEGRSPQPDAAPEEPFLGAQPLYVQARAAHTQARADQRSATAQGCAFVAKTVDTLKSFLGRRWNSRWLPLGFENGSLALAAEPQAHLLSIASHLRRHPEHQCAQFEITSERAEAISLLLVQTRAAAATAKRQEVLAKQARDAAVRQLRRRLTALRSELALLLEPSDSRWYCFGFRRPIDSRCPEVVAEVNVRETRSGEATITWSASVRAEGYRVTCRTSDENSPPVQTALVSDCQAFLNNLPRDKALIIAVSARNRVGESQPREVTITPIAPPASPNSLSERERSGSLD